MRAASTITSLAFASLFRGPDAWSSAASARGSVAHGVDQLCGREDKLANANEVMVEAARIRAPRPTTTE